MADSPAVARRGFLTTALSGSGTLDLGPLEVEFNRRLVAAGITIDANGVITFGVSPTGITSVPGGSNTQVQFNDAGSLAGDAGMTYNKATDTLTVTNLAGAGAAITGVPISTGVSGLGTGVATALAVNVGTAGAPVVNGGALGTPSSGTLTSCTGLPVGSGVSGLGTGVATALAVNVGTAGSPVVNGGALGTPSSGTLSNCTSLPISTGVSGLGASVATFLATPSSANLASALTDETGSGAAVFGTSPTFTTDVRGAMWVGAPGGRLTLTTAVPVTTADVTAAATLYYTPYVSNTVSLYNGTTWVRQAFTERSLSLTLTSGKNYDVFLYDNSGTLTLELSQAWTNDTTRADALALQDGVYVKSGSTGRLWLGTIRASGTNTTEDSATKRFVWNAYHRARRQVGVVDTTNSWTYATATWRQSNNSTANQVAIVTGQAWSTMSITASGAHSSSAGNAVGATGVGYDVTNAYSGITGYAYKSAGGTSTSISQIAALSNMPAAGYHYYAWLEYCVTGGGTDTWYGDNGQTYFQTGMSGTWES